MIYILLIALILTGVLLWLRFAARKRLIRNLERAVNLVKVGLYSRLLARYLEVYEREFAVCLAAAMTNEVFSEQPSNEIGRAFLVGNGPLVDRELRKLSADLPLRSVLTQTVRAMTVIPFAKGDHTPGSLYDPLARLTELDILIPYGEFPSQQEFLAAALEFYESRPSV